MALFKSQVLTQASGSVGGLTYTRTPSGMVIRARSMPVNPRTAQQIEIRNAMSLLSGRWSVTLTDAQRTAWAVYAATVKVRNKLGDQVSLSGIAMYVRCNTPRVQAGLTVIDDGPTDMTTGDPVAKGVLLVDPTGSGSAELDWTAPGTATGDVLVYASTGKPAGINFFKGPYRYNAKDTYASQSAALVWDSSWAEGNRVFVRARITYPDGRLSPATEYQALSTVPTP